MSILDCIYFNCKGNTCVCKAHPVIGEVYFYKPTEADVDKYCKNDEKFDACPRYEAYQDHLKASAGIKV